MKQPGLDGRHRDLPRDESHKWRLDAKAAIGTKPKVRREKLAEAFDSASRSSGAFTNSRAR